MNDTRTHNKLSGKRLFDNIEYEGCNVDKKSKCSNADNNLRCNDMQTENSETKVDENDEEKGLLSGGFVNVGEDSPPPKKIHKGVSVCRRYPPRCGRQNTCVSSSKFSNEQRPSVQRNDKQNRVGTCSGGYAFGRKSIGKNRGEMESKFNPQIVTNKDEYLLEANGSKDRFNNYKQDDSRKKVKEALYHFKETYKKVLEEHKAKSDKYRKSSFTLLVKAANELKKQDKWVNTEEHSTGPVPGIEVGDKFNFRVELAIVGLHRQYFRGIDYVVDIYGKSYATSIVDSGRYTKETEYSESDVLIYSGQGGNPKVACQKLADQKLERGNLALKNSMNARSPVRVIRCYPFSKTSSPQRPSSEKRAYIYDGLYKVTKCWQTTGEYGKRVFMFRLERIKGQRKLAPLEPTPVREIQSRKSQDRYRICVVNDISQGKEKNAIHAMNSTSNEKPPLFNYITDMIYPELNDFSMPRGCDCVNGCSNSEQCSCMVKNGGELPYNDNGDVIKEKPIIYECGPLCKCPSSCKNRISQFGVQYKLEVFKTESRGWGVRCRSFISAGRFICEYAGEVFQHDKADKFAGKDEYSVDIGTHNNGLRDGENGFIIDATHFGNVGRFIKHSSEPNLYVQNVLYDHEEERMPHVMLFSSNNIRPLRELTCDFKYRMG